MRNEIKPEHRHLIETIVCENPKFKNNEELIDIFCDAVYKKSYLLIDAIKDVPRLKRHLQIICDGCMDGIIREKQKYTKANPYKRIRKSDAMNEVVNVKSDTRLYDADDINAERKAYKSTMKIVNLKEEIQRSERYSATDMLIDPLDFCPQKRVSENTVEKLTALVKSISKKYPNKRYYDIFILRYIKNLNQSEIAREMKISQIELSKRFVELINLAHESL